MAKVLTISSQVVWGPVGNTAAVPPLQAMGHEVLQVPTTLLSHHPGHGRPVVHRFESSFLKDVLRSVADRGGFDTLSAVMTGFFANADQVGVAAHTIAGLTSQFPGLMVLVDPVIGDGEALYVAEDVAIAIRDQLLPLATIITPNVFELGWLTTRTVTDEASAKAAVLALGRPEALVTSLAPSPKQIGTLLVDRGETHLVVSERRPRMAHGTGDFLSGAYLAARLKFAPRPAFSMAMARLRAAISASEGGSVLKPIAEAT